MSLREAMPAILLLAVGLFFLWLLTQYIPIPRPGGLR